MKYSKNSTKTCHLDELVTKYNKMMDDPKEYANTTYKSQITSQGRPYGGERDTRNRANKSWGKNDVPV